METDKILHLLAGYAVALTFGIFSPAAGAVAGILAAFGKEFVWDKWMKRGTFEWQDLNVTLVGVLVGRFAVEQFGLVAFHAAGEERGRRHLLLDER